MYAWSKTRWMKLKPTETKTVRSNPSIRLMGTVVTDKNKTYSVWQDVSVLPTAKCVTNLHHVFNRFVLYRPVYVISKDGSCPPTNKDDRLPSSPSPKERTRQKVLHAFRKSLGCFEPPDGSRRQCTDTMAPFPDRSVQTESTISTWEAKTSLFTDQKPTTSGTQSTKIHSGYQQATAEQSDCDSISEGEDPSYCSEFGGRLDPTSRGGDSFIQLPASARSVRHSKHGSGRYKSKDNNSSLSTYLSDSDTDISGVDDS